MSGHVAQVGKEEEEEVLLFFFLKEDDALLVTAQLGQRQIARDAVTLESTTHQLARAATAGIWTKKQDPQTLDDDGKAPAPGDSRVSFTAQGAAVQSSLQ